MSDLGALWEKVVQATTVKSRFEAAVNVVRGLPATGPVQPSNDQRLAFYSLFKQATSGPAVPSARPAFWDVVGRAKHDAWAARANLDPETAMRMYVSTLVDVANALPREGALADFIAASPPHLRAAGKLVLPPLPADQLSANVSPTAATTTAVDSEEDDHEDQVEQEKQYETRSDARSEMSDRDMFFDPMSDSTEPSRVPAPATESTIATNVNQILSRLQDDLVSNTQRIGRVEESIMALRREVAALSSSHSARTVMQPVVVDVGLGQLRHRVVMHLSLDEEHFVFTASRK